MTKRIFVTATNTDIGKTYAALKLIETFTALCYRVGAVKPIETGVQSLPADGERLLQAIQRHNPLTKGLLIDDVVPVQMPLPAAPFVALKGNSVDYTAIDAAIARMERLCDICIIEGAGGLLVPVDATTDMIDMIERYDAKTLLVSHCRLGCINDTRLSLSLLKNRRLSYEWVLNCRDDDHGFSSTSQPWFDAHFDPWFRLDQDVEALCRRLLL